MTFLRLHVPVYWLLAALYFSSKSLLMLLLHVWPGVSQQPLMYVTAPARGQGWGIYAVSDLHAHVYVYYISCAIRKPRDSIGRARVLGLQ